MLQISKWDTFDHFGYSSSLTVKLQGKALQINKTDTGASSELEPGISFSCDSLNCN